MSKEKDREEYVGTLISRRDLLKCGGALAALALSGCGAPAPTTAPPAGPTATTAAAVPTATTAAAAAPTAAGPGGPGVMGGDVIWGSAISETSILQLDPLIHASYTTSILSFQITDPLIWQYEANDFRPGLATRWEISPNWDEFTLYLRDDVVFHDGKPFNAEAVKLNFERILDPDSKSLRVADYSMFDHAEVIDDYTVKIYLNAKNPIFLDTLSNTYPSSPEGWATYGDQWGVNVKATGPFRIKEWPDAGTVVFERNPDYNWAPEFANHQGPSYLDTLTYKSIVDENTRLIALETGEIQIMDELPMEQYQRLASDPSFVIVSEPVGGLPQVLNINMSVTPTDSLAVRSAMIMAVDTKTMVDLLFFGAFTPAAPGPFGEGTWAYWPGVEEYWKYDPEKAKQILEDAGWRDEDGDGIREAHGVEGVEDGTPLRIRHVTSTGYRSEKPAEFVQAALKEIGMDDVVEAMAYEESAKRYADNEYEMARLGWSAFDPGSTARLFHCDSIESGGRFNRWRLCDPEIDALIEQGDEETDPAKRMEIYQEFQKRIVELAPHIPIYNQVRYRTFLPTLQGYHSPPVGANPRMHEAWLQT
jgi:peptide/nickel transport system substrate-binding protein